MLTSKEKHMNNAIFICVDRNYEKYARACFNSLETNYLNHPIVLVYSNYPTDEFSTYIHGLKNYKLIHYQQFFTDNALGPIGNEIVYNKFRLWSNEFDEYDTVLHLDVDLLVVKSLESYFNIEDFFIVVDGLEDFVVNAFHNCDDRLGNLLQEDKIDFDYKKPSFMYNAGVFCVPKKYRTQENLDELIHLTRRYSQYLRFADQTAITLWCYRHHIKPSYKLGKNYLTPFFGHKSTWRKPEDIHIIHFIDRKPDTINFVLWDRIPATTSRALVLLYHQYLA
jgi:lipopolysaccharide biosynthesis glycosyltransferase